MKKVISLLLTVLMIAACASVFASCGGENETKSGVVKIGGIGALTGDYASYGTSVRNGATIAVEQLNKENAVEGFTFELLFEDSQGDPTKAVSAFGKLQDNGMNVSLGGVMSGETASIVAASKESGILAVSPSASALDCIGEKNAFRVCFNDPQQGEIAAQTISTKSLATKVAMFYDNGNDYCVGNATTFKTKCAELGIEIVTEQTYTEATNTDFQTQITAIKDSGAELVFMPIYYNDAAKFLRQAVDTLDTVFFGVDGLDGVIKECGENVSDCEDAILLTPFYANATEGVTKTFVDAYKAKYNETPDQFAADGYDAVMAIAAALKQTGLKAAEYDAMKAEDFNAQMVGAMTKITVEGATGTMKWTADGECNKAPLVLQIKNGEYVVYGG